MTGCPKTLLTGSYKELRSDSHLHIFHDLRRDLAVGRLDTNWIEIQTIRPEIDSLEIKYNQKKFCGHHRFCKQGIIIAWDSKEYLSYNEEIPHEIFTQCVCFPTI